MHHPALPDEPRDPIVEAYNARLGLWLFALYALAFLGFVLLNAMWPQSMETIVVAGLNLAITYGFGLIIGAFLLALVYASCCRVPGAGKS
jgi:uncharacterized membrane protein (DUF485 family)